MAYEFKITYDKEITANEKGIYYCDVSIIYNNKNFFIEKQVYSKPSEKEFVKNLINIGLLQIIGFKDIKHKTQFIHLKIIYKVYLSDVQKIVYDRWKNS